MSSATEISDDDESFDQLDQSDIKEIEDIIDISSDATEEYYTSDDEGLPAVDVKRSAVIKNLFPSKPGPSTSSFNPTLQSSTTAKTTLNPQGPQGHNFQHVPTGPEVISSAPKLPGIEKMIGGVKVVLPVEPYGSQTVLMFKLITAIKTRQNCLLESPTGSGKTLALLCGALAWLQQERDILATSQASQLASKFPELRALGSAVEYIASPRKDLSPEKLFGKTAFGERSIYDKPQNGAGGSNGKRPEPMQDTCCDAPSPEVTIYKKRKLNGTPEKWQRQDSPNRTPEKPVVANQAETPEEIRVPIIYYGARTHKQLQQVIKEFSRTAYCGQVAMTVLSSRDYSCIREFDRNQWKTKNDMCRGCVKTNLTSAQKKRQETNCSFYNNRGALHHEELPPAFDLEDLVRVGYEKSACPYYAAREMAKMAQIVFCPYNYLIEPGIRSSMGIELQDNIVIIDEAHNIEDICRDAASCAITQDHVLAAITELETCTKYRYANQDSMHYLDYVLLSLRNWDQWFHNQQALVRSKPVNNNEAVHTWEVEHFATTLNNHNIGEKQYSDFSGAAQVLITNLRETPDRMYGLTQATATLVETLQIVLGYVFREAGRFKDDFKPALVRAVSGSGDLADSKAWRNSQFDKWVDKDSLSLRLVCLNPAVVFSGLKNARCIALASGTLTPLLSLHSELAASFPLQVSPNHVIPRHRVWIGTLTTCTDGTPLECTSKGADKPSTQDSLGECVRWVCDVTPHGVLCFLPSYSLMNRLRNRWQETGLWSKLTELKHVFTECRNARDHNDIMEDYYRYVSSGRGALLFAVYRGKVSEGMDFKDHQARAVITVGVPYPNTFDMAVKEKMKYNDRYSSERGLLPSREWLRVQAYRALNQAVGRCVRHRGDWGAVLLADSRFANPYYTEHLSKWVRNFLGNNHHTFNSLTDSTNSNGLETFMKAMTIEQQSEDMAT